MKIKISEFYLAKSSSEVDHAGCVRSFTCHFITEKEKKKKWWPAKNLL